MADPFWTAIHLLASDPPPPPAPPKKEEPKPTFGWPDKGYYDIFPPMPVGAPSSTALRLAIAGGGGIPGQSEPPNVQAKTEEAMRSMAFGTYMVPGEMRTSWNALRCLQEGRVKNEEDTGLSASMGWAIVDLAEEATKKELAK